jgi:hypothetical protein
MTTGLDDFKEPSSGLTVAQFCEYIAPSVWSDLAILKWPPDVFALAAALLLKSGAYVHAVSGWQRHGKLKQWVKEVREIGYAWHDNPDDPPEPVRKWYENLRSKAPIFVEDMCAHDICGEDDLCCTLIQLCSAADEACVGVGCTLPNPDDVDPFLEDASEMLFIKRDELKGPGGSERYN